MNDPRTYLEKLVDFAILAPSGDNRQPWKFLIEPSLDQISIQLDEMQDCSPMNADQRMSRIAIGAAMENLRRTCELNRIPVHVKCNQSACIVKMEFNDDHRGIEPDPIIAQRVSNRQPYDGRILPPQVLKTLQKSIQPSSDIQVQWITEDEQRGNLVKLIARGDALLFGSRILRNAFLRNVRFDCPPEEEVDWGLSLGSLELSRGELRAFQALPKLPAWLLQILRIGHTFAKGTQRLAESASGFCLGLAANDEPTTDIAAGSMMQRAWLALTEQGLAIQPMMSLLVLENILQHGDESLQKAVGISKLKCLNEELRRFTAKFGTGRPAFLLRFGYAPPPSDRCGRRPPKIHGLD